MMRIVSVPFFNLRNASTTKRTRPPVEKPRRFHRCSVRDVFKILPIKRFGICENRCRFLEWNTVFIVVLQGLAGVPGEHIYVYTLITTHSPTKEKGGPLGPPFRKNYKTKNKKQLLRFRCFHSVECHRQPRLIPVPRILVQHALADGHINRRQRRLQQSPGRIRVARADGRAQPLDQRAHPRPVRPVHFRSLTSLRRSLQNGLLLLLYFGSMSLGHLLLLMGSSQTSNGKRGLPLCQTTQRVFPPGKPSRSRPAPHLLRR